MRVLVVVTRVPHPLGKGDAKLAFQSVEVLKGAGHLVSVISDTERRTGSRMIRAFVSALVSRKPAQLAVTRSASLRAELKRALEHGSPDMIVAVHARAGEQVPLGWRHRCFLILVDALPRNYASYRGRVPLFLDLIYRIERRRVVKYDMDACKTFGKIGVVSSTDADHLRRGTAYHEKVVHLPLAVDLAYFSQTDRRPSRTPVFLFFGRLNYLPNRHAASLLITTIWPHIKAAMPQAALRLVGADAPNRLRQLAQAHAIELVRDPPDLRPELGRATAVVIPMAIGGGVQNKILEAMAAGVPVICSSFANEGIGAADGRQLLLADSPAGYALHCRRVVEEPEYARHLAEQARAWVREHHSMGNFAAVLVPECESLSGGGKVCAPLR